MFPFEGQGYERVLQPYQAAYLAQLEASFPVRGGCSLLGIANDYQHTAGELEAKQTAQYLWGVRSLSDGV